MNNMQISSFVSILYAIAHLIVATPDSEWNKTFLMNVGLMIQVQDPNLDQINELTKMMMGTLIRPQYCRVEKERLKMTSFIVASSLANRKHHKSDQELR